MQVFEVTAITQHTITSALDVMTRYQFSYWDSLIVAAALESICPCGLGCGVVFKIALGFVGIINPYRF